MAPDPKSKKKAKQKAIKPDANSVEFAEEVVDTNQPKLKKGKKPKKTYN